MARRYARDNRGRFASTGTGATARGGRLRTAAGNKRKTKKIAAMSGDRMSSVPKDTIGRTRKQREITMIDRPQAQRPAYNAGRAKQQAAIAARKAPKAVAARRVKAVAPANTVANKTGQSKTLNKFNSRPERTRGAYVGGRYVDKSKLSGRQPLDLGRSDDRAFGRVATKAARSRAAAAKPAAKPAASKVDTTAAGIARRRSRAMANRSSIAGGDFNMKLTTQSAITRSAANAIYNRQREVAKASGGRIDPSVARSGIGVVRGLSGSNKQRAQQLREQARKRVVGGRRR